MAGLVHEHALAPGEALALCTWPVWDVLGEARIGEVVGGSPGDAPDRLLAELHAREPLRDGAAAVVF